MTCSGEQPGWAIRIDSHIDCATAHVIHSGEIATHAITITNIGPLGGMLHITATCPKGGNLTYVDLGTRWTTELSISGNDPSEIKPPTIPLEWKIRNGNSTQLGLQRVKVKLEISGPEQRTEKMKPVLLYVDCK
jgi:hypothetical protein